MKLAHIGIAVKSLNESVPVFEKIFNVNASKTEFVEMQKVNVRKLHLENCDIELLEGTDADSPITKFIEKKGEGIHHVSFEVSDIQSKLDEIKEGGIRLINETPVIGADEMLVAFLHPKSTNSVLMEFTEKQKQD
ncbi:MAG: methylmalonyl-CoA epimerase [Ignavibacteria bacterium]|nr:methylmalonyl-CoA epimerase [Ignavibacteria bacterium]